MPPPKKLRSDVDGNRCTKTIESCCHAMDHLRSWIGSSDGNLGTLPSEEDADLAAGMSVVSRKVAPLGLAHI